MDPRVKPDRPVQFFGARKCCFSHCPSFFFCINIKITFMFALLQIITEASRGLSRGLDRRLLDTRWLVHRSIPTGNTRKTIFFYLSSSRCLLYRAYRVVRDLVIQIRWFICGARERPGGSRGPVNKRYMKEI